MIQPLELFGSFVVCETSLSLTVLTSASSSFFFSFCNCKNYSMTKECEKDNSTTIPHTSTITTVNTYEVCVIYNK